MPLNSRDKGARRELEWRDVLRAFGYVAERGQQHAGSADSPDVKHDLPGVHFEVKGVEQPSWNAWFSQAVRDAGGRLPVIAWKRNRVPWLVVMRPQDFIALVERAALVEKLK